MTAQAQRKPNRFDYVAYDSDAQAQQSAFKEMFSHLAQEVEKFPPGRAQSLVLTKLEEAYMWVGKMVRDHQIAKTGHTPLQEARGPQATPPPDQL